MLIITFLLISAEVTMIQGGDDMIVEVFGTFARSTQAVLIKCEGWSIYDSIINQMFSRTYTQFSSDLGNISTNSPQNLMFILNLQCVNSTGILSKAEIMNYFSFPYRWLLITNKIQKIYEINALYLKKLSLKVDSNVYLCQKENDGYKIDRLFRDKFTQIQIEYYGFWSKDIGFVPMSQNLGNKRRNLNKTILKTAIVITHNDSVKHLTDYRDKHIDSITKVNYVLVHHLADIVNASLIFTVKNSWGYKNNSNWTGMIGELINNNAEIGGTPLFVTTDRVAVVEYAAMTTPTKSYFIFREPKLSYVYNVFWLPFHWTVWLCTLMLLVIITMALTVALHWERIKNKNKEILPELSPSDSLLLSVGAMCQQGAATLPADPPGRTITLFTFLSLMFLYTSYSANIVALLQSSASNINTLTDLLHSRIKVGVDDTVFNRFYFPAATEPVRRALFLQKVEPPGQSANYYTIEEGVNKIRGGLFAFHVESGAGYKIVGDTFFEHEKCDLSEISFLQVPDPWLAIKKNSTYKEILKTGLRRLQETGLQNREYLKIYTKKPECQGRGTSFVTVGIIECYPAAMVLLIGIGLSIGILIIEIFIKNRQKKIEQILKKREK